MTTGVMMTDWIPTADNDPRWKAPLNRLMAALASGDTGAIIYEWHVACLEARAASDWEGMLAIAEAAIRVGQATGLTLAYTTEARQALQAALFRAQRQHSADGIRRIAVVFDALGDHDAVEQCRLLAARLAAGDQRLDKAEPDS